MEDVIDTVVYDDRIHGSVIVLNPKTGAIQAMTSWPGFNLNDLSRGLLIEEWNALQNDKANIPPVQPRNARFVYAGLCV